MSVAELRMLYDVVRTWDEVVEVDDSDPYNPIIQFGVVGEIAHGQICLIPPHKVQLNLYSRNMNGNKHWDSRARTLDGHLGSHPKFWKRWGCYNYQDGSVCVGNALIQYDNPPAALAQLRQFYVASVWEQGLNMIGRTYSFYPDTWWKANAKAWYKKYPNQVITLVDSRRRPPQVRRFKPTAKFIREYEPGMMWTEDMQNALLK